MNIQRKNQANILVKECMVTALIQLLKEKPLSMISISELTERAGVSRMSYYRNYHTKEDIFVSYLEELLADYKKDLALSFSKNYYDMENLIHAFSYFQKHDEFIHALFKCGFEHNFLNTVTRCIIEKWYTLEDGIEQFYTLQAFAGSLYNLYISWSISGFKETPEKMAQILHHVYR